MFTIGNFGADKKDELDVSVIPSYEPSFRSLFARESEAKANRHR
jgi:ABC-type cobalt transport system substrate-binding protein